MTKPKHYDAVQRAIRNMETNEAIPFGVTSEDITLHLTTEELAFLRLVHDDEEDLRYRLDILLSEAVWKLAQEMKGNPDHVGYYLTEDE